MSVELYAKAADADPQHFHLSSESAVIIFELCGAVFGDEVGETTAAMALDYAHRVRQTLGNGEFERVHAEETGDDPSFDDRAEMEEFAQFCERCGGYTMWV